jgi:hypothetical protein
MNERGTMQIRSPHFCAVPYPSGECWQIKTIIDRDGKRRTRNDVEVWREVNCYPTTLERAIECVWEYEALHAAKTPEACVMTADECREFGTYLVNRVADIADEMQARLGGDE